MNDPGNLVIYEFDDIVKSLFRNAEDAGFPILRVVELGFPPNQYTHPDKLSDRIAKLAKAASIVAPFDESTADGYDDPNMPDLPEMFVNNVICFLQNAPLNKTHAMSLKVMNGVMKSNSHLTSQDIAWNRYQSVFESLDVFTTTKNQTLNTSRQSNKRPRDIDDFSDESVDV
jgi:hypothetical protein